MASTGSGTITFKGIAGAGTDNNTGILVDINSKVTSLNGTISLTGIGVGTGTKNYGIGIQNVSLVESTGSGTITFVGNAGAGTDNNRGISVANSTVKSLNGNITMTGTGAGTGITKTNYGIALDSNAAVEATAANVDMTGKGVGGADAINLTNSSINLTPGSGKDVTLTGDEITLFGTSKVNGTGTILLQPLTPNLDISVGGIANNPNVLNLSTAEITSPVINGFSQMIIGRGNGAGTIAVDPLGVTFNYPIALEAPNTSGAIVVNGPITATGSATVTLNGVTKLNANITTQDKSISFLKDVSLGNDVTLTTQKTLNVTSGGNITFGGTVDGNNKLTINAGTNTINFNKAVGGTTPLAELVVYQGANITSTGAINITTKGNIALDSIKTSGGAIALTSMTGDIRTFGNIDPTSIGTAPGANITLKAGNIVDVFGGLNAGQGDISLTGMDVNFPLANTVKGTGTFSLLPLNQNGNIIFKVGYIAPANTISLGTAFQQSMQDGFKSIAIGRPDGTGTITFDSAHFFLDPVTIQSPKGAIVINQPLTGTDNASIVFDGPTTLNKNVTTSGQNITFQSPVLVENNAAVSTGKGAGNILFNNTVNGAATGTKDLSLTAGTGNITFTGAVGATSAIGNLTANSTGTTAFNQTVNAASLTTDVGGKTTLNGNVTTTGSQTYGDAVTITNINPVLTGTGITFNNTVNASNSGSALTVDGGTGDVTFNGAIGSSNNSIGNLTANSTATTAFNQAVNAASVTTDAGGTTQIKANVTTTGSQTYADAVTIANNPILAGSDVTFNNVDGSSDLTVKASSGNITFGGAVGTGSAIGNLTANSTGITAFNKTVNAGSVTTDAGGTTQIKANITTTGSQTYGDAVTIANNPILAGKDITFNNKVDVAGNLGIAGDNVDIKGTVTTTNKGTLTITNQVNLNIDKNLNLDGAFTQKGAGTVALSGNIATTNDDIRFSGPVTLKAPVTFTLGDATIAFGSSLAAGTNSLSLTAGEIDFSGNVSGTGALTLQPATAGQNIAIGGIANNTPALDLTASEIGLIQNGFSSIVLGRSDGTANVSIPNNVLFLDPVTIQGGTGAIAVNGTLTGNDNSSIALNASTINLNSGINTNKNAIALNGNVKLGNDITLSSGGGDISIVGAIDGTRLLNLNAGAGNVLVQGNIGGTAPLSVLNVTGTKAEFTSGNIASNSGFNISAANTSLGGNVTTNQGNININGTLGLTKDVLLITAGGNIALSGAIDSIGAARSLNLDAGSGSITFNGAVGATSKLGNILIKNAGNVIQKATINAQQLTAQNTKKVEFSEDVTASKVNINASGDIAVKNVTTNGGEILFNSGNVFTAGNLNTSGSIGANITVKAITSITAGQINSSGTVGKAGNVLLDPIGDIQVESINAQGGTGGTGADVSISTGNFFRATGGFSTPLSPGFTSISTAGGTGGGQITIAHAGGDKAAPIQPFVVGNATTNGTAGAINTGQSSITSQSFPRSSSVGNIAFSTDDAIDPIPTPTPTPSTTPTPTPSTTPTPTPSTTPQINQPTIPQINQPTIPQINQPTIPQINQPTIPQINQPTIPQINQPTIPQINQPTIPQINQPTITQINQPTIPQINQPTIPQINQPTIPQINQPTIPQINQPTTGEINPQIRQIIGQIIEPSAPQESLPITSIDSLANPLSPRTIDSLANPLSPRTIAPTATPATPTTAATASTPDPEDFQRRRQISPLDTPGAAAGQILRLDSSITSKLPPSQQPTPPNETTPSLKPTSNLALGYVPSPDRLFEGNDIQKTIWGIEQTRNQEFGEYLGVKANLPDPKIMIATFQQTLRNIEQQTGKRSAIIYIVSRIDRLELILVPPVGRPIHYSVPEANRAALFPVVKELRDEITNPAKRGTSNYLASAQQLYKWAIAPLEKDLQNLGIETLLLSVDPGLRSMPFAALHDGKGFLIEKYSFSLIPSFSLTNNDYKPVRDATVLAMGRSEFVDNKPLFSVPIELEAIAAEWHGPSFLNSNFTLENLNSEHTKRGFRIVHLATHAHFKAGSPSNSYIQMWNSKLQLDRMESLNWRDPQVDLLVLSACQTALGDRESELGFGGLAVKSGAKSALGSLWYVDDGGTLGLMSEFYHQLRGAATKAQTLQLTQQAMIARKVRIENRQLVTTSGKLNLPAQIQEPNQNFAHPYYWSGFTLIGSPW
ncbi:CHAT domain-containing protein [Microcoleus sp. bin38.metabat.b11b12b14.051]|uniref:CHAT domain-containing protein n=1 Tax=Microcoleus sp. bin38.metabat.b11b12b14.051 TaxID=2742709 RepID=UPI0025DF9BCB|nr:CHAT domain-containing protein [Microcoleus sp. bin38.metabat.b11b12b14.051]